MKQNTILAIILLAMILFILSLPSKAQTGNPSHQLKIEKVVFTGKWKAEITVKKYAGRNGYNPVRIPQKPKKKPITGNMDNRYSY